jgi:extracellular factor (EF) 3-hydroxypalmitic acid methyl ester biosynthesis protein
MESAFRCLEYLSLEDRRLFAQQSKRGRFRKDELILEEGSRRETLFIIVSGRVRIVRTHFGSKITIAALDVGQIFGEMAYLEGIGSSASVYADADDTELLVLSANRLRSLLVTIPGLAGRFYQSVAVLLAQKLRRTNARH